MFQPNSALVEKCGIIYPFTNNIFKNNMGIFFRLILVGLQLRYYKISWNNFITWPINKQYI